VYGQATANIPTTSMPVNATADIVQVSGGQVTVHMTPVQYEQTPDNELRRILIE
jgi:hypothetical protein